MNENQNNACTKDIPSSTELMEIIRKTISNVWNIGNRLHQPCIDRWLDNFDGEALFNDYCDKEKAAQREKQLALFLLCNFVFYNENEVKYLVKMMFSKYSHSVFESEEKQWICSDDYDALIEKTQFSFLGEISESSSYLLYHFRQENDLSKQCFREGDKTENIVFIDDFSITGSQAAEYFKEKREEKTWDKNRKIYILLMIATEEALETMAQIEDVTILSCIVLDDKSKAFSDTSIIFNGYKREFVDEAKKMCEYYGDRIIKPNMKGMKALGFGGGGYLMGTYYNIPDNTLPIFWSSLNNWNYLFKRYDKKYGSESASIGGYYV